jgi:hypothetical protein
VTPGGRPHARRDDKSGLGGARAGPWQRQWTDPGALLSGPKLPDEAAYQKSIEVPLTLRFLAGPERSRHIIKTLASVCDLFQGVDDVALRRAVAASAGHHEPAPDVHALLVVREHASPAGRIAVLVAPTTQVTRLPAQHGGWLAAVPRAVRT